jgi:hypothetical protein
MRPGGIDRKLTLTYIERLIRDTPFYYNMSWIVVGDSQHATFACNTVDRSFGPLNYAYSDETNAEEELREFGEQLDKDPRRYTEDELASKLYEWRKA